MQKIAYQVVRSNRKSVALVIDNEANLIVRAPALMPDVVIEEFVRKKRRWINEKQQQVAVFGEKHPPVVVETGESIMYLGSSYAIIKDAVDAVEISGNELVVPEDYDVEAMTAWLKEQAMQTISERVALYANIMGVKGVLTADVLLSSPSSAAGFVGGASLSGNALWKDADGKTLRELLETD